MAAAILAAAALAGSASFAAAAEITVWFAPSALKIKRDARPVPAAPLRGDIAAARNEAESCQLALRADIAVRSVAVSVSDLVGPGGRGYLRPSLYKVEYVPIWEEKEPFPDPLPPLRGPFDLEAGRTQPVWITVRVPAEAAPGDYQGVVTVASASGTRRLPFKLHVWDFALPVTPSSQTAFGLDYSGIAEFHDVEPGSARAQALNRKYYEFLLDHRVSPYNLPVDLASDEAVPYLDDPRMTSYNIPIGTKSDAELKLLVQRLIAGGWFAKGYFYEVDEPITKAAFDALVAVSGRIRAIEPRSRMVTPFWGNPDFDKTLRSKDVMLGRVGIWCPHLLYMESEPGFPRFLLDRRNAGDTIWWYNCGGLEKWDDERAPYNNLDIPLSAMSCRVLLWQQRRFGLQGLLYWNTTYWHKKYTPDPWVNTVMLEPRKCGDGMLLYPGNKVGIDGPVGSLRLEVLRDGLEDFDYLALADQRLEPNASRAFIARVARTLTDYERDPLKLEAVRRELGAALEKATAEKRKTL